MSKQPSLRELNEAVRAALANLSERRAEIQAEIAELKIRRAEVEAAPVPKAVALERLDKQIAATAADFAMDIQVADLWSAEWRPGALKIAEIFFEPGQVIQQDNLNPLLCLFFGDIIRKRFKAALDREYDELATSGIEPLTDERRKRALVEIDAKIRELEEAEETLTIEAQAAGIDMPRRGDLSPEAFLEVHDASGGGAAAAATEDADA